MYSNDASGLTDVCIVGVARTPMGGLSGSLSSLSATKLGSTAIQGEVYVKCMFVESIRTLAPEVCDVASGF